MGFLDEASSWTLFSKTIYGEQSFPTQLERIGKKIVEKCNGLPLAIVVIGGLLAKSEVTLEYWEHIKENISSIVNTENDDYCLRILRLSYNHLPVYLKPCFLYMGVFGEDRVIGASTIVKLWVSEGFLKPINNTSLTTIAKACLKELVDRNLFLVHKLGLLGNIKYCKFHDLLRDVSMNEAKKQRFSYVLREQSPQEVIGHHSIVISRSTSKGKIRDALNSMSHARSLICHENGVQELPNSRFLRTLYANHSPYTFENCLENVFHLVNSRCLAFRAKWGFVIPSINLLWNLETLIIYCERDFIAPIEIWKMHKLRHVEFERFNLHLPDPPSIDNDIIIMENLETLKGVRNFNLSEDVVKRIPNIKKLKVCYRAQIVERVNGLGYLQCLSKLESFDLWVYSVDDRKCLLNLSFPPTLKKLILFLPIDFKLEDMLPTDFELEDILPADFGWEDILPMVGALPLLQKLHLSCGRFRTGKWETIEGQFPSLKSLTLLLCDNLENWTVLESSHFPLLQELSLSGLKELKEIPSEIGEIPTLRFIELDNCSESAVLSAKQMLEKQEDLYGVQPDLHVRVIAYDKYKALQKLSNSNFKVSVSPGD